MSTLSEDQLCAALGVRTMNTPFLLTRNNHYLSMREEANGITCTFGALNAVTSEPLKGWILSLRDFDLDLLSGALLSDSFYTDKISIYTIRLDDGFVSIGLDLKGKSLGRIITFGLYQQPETKTSILMAPSECRKMAKWCEYIRLWCFLRPRMIELISGSRTEAEI